MIILTTLLEPEDDSAARLCRCCQAQLSDHPMARFCVACFLALRQQSNARTSCTLHGREVSTSYTG